MSVFVTWEDWEGELLGQVVELLALPRLFPRNSGMCLRFCSEMEDASFNVSQLPFLLQEVESLEPVAEDEKKERLQVLSLLNKASRKGKGAIRLYGEQAKG